MPWNDWQFWLVTVLAALGVLRMVRLFITPQPRRCGRCKGVTDLTIESERV
ncbi:MAG: hypothetical protein JSV91_09660 [Phycisphaerales bacterium]|nr:MAG: hypothetical protein JSV91_09660 [Phycisphaerales bacterium]